MKTIKQIRAALERQVGAYEAASKSLSKEKRAKHLETTRAIRRVLCKDCGNDPSANKKAYAFRPLPLKLVRDSASHLRSSPTMSVENFTLLEELFLQQGQEDAPSISERKNTTAANTDMLDQDNEDDGNTDDLSSEVQLREDAIDHIAFLVHQLEMLVLEGTTSDSSMTEDEGLDDGLDDDSDDGTSTVRGDDQEAYEEVEMSGQYNNDMDAMETQLGSESEEETGVCSWLFTRPALRGA